jgi:glycosyltransferase involved in cell wall biosynthesis
VPVVLETRHGIPERLRRLYRSAPAATRWEGWKCGLARVTICVCHADAEWMAERAGVPRSRLRVIPNGVPLRAPGAPADPTERREAARRRRDLPLDRPVVGFLGRLAPQKAPHRFLETLAAVRKEADVLGVICGVGPLEPALRARAAEMGLLDHVRWMGEVADGRSLIAAFDLLLLPSTWEGAPYVVLEGLAEETPILATPVGGIPEILAGAPLDLSLADWSPGAWLDRTRSFLFDPALSAEWKRAARVRAERFREETMVASVDDLYRELMGA